MPRFRWTRYFTLKEGSPTSFASGKFPAGVNLADPNIEIETVKRIYESGVPFLEPTEAGIKKFYPQLKKKK